MSVEPIYLIVAINSLSILFVVLVLARHLERHR